MHQPNKSDSMVAKYATIIEENKERRKYNGQYSVLSINTKSSDNRISTLYASVLPTKKGGVMRKLKQIMSLSDNFLNLRKGEYTL